MSHFINLEEIPPCWILSTPRSGSSLLCELLNKTNLFNPIFVEYYNDQYCKNLYNIATNYKFKKYNKMMRYPLQISNISCKIFYTNLVNKFSNIRFIHLVRTNIFKQALSLFFSSKTRIWLYNINNIHDYRDIPYNYSEILESYNFLYQAQWNDSIFLLGGQKYLDITYEKFISDIDLHMNKIMNFLNIKNNINWGETYRKISKSEQMISPYPRKQEYYERFLKEYCIRNNCTINNGVLSL